MDPENNLYPHDFICCNFQRHDSKYCHITDMKSKIYAAAYFLQPDILSKLLDEVDIDTLSTYNYGYLSTVPNDGSEQHRKILSTIGKNILEALCATMAFIVTPMVNTEKHFVKCKMANDSIKNDMYIILKIIMEKSPTLITKKCYTYLKAEKSCECMLDLLNSYDKDSTSGEDLSSELRDKHENETCMICEGDEKIDMIFPTDNFCDCKFGYIHIKCMAKLIEASPDGNCKTCNKQYCRNEKCICNGGKIDTRIYFPQINVYKQPLITSMYTNYTDQKYKGLNLAIAYLQTKRVNEILDEMDNEAFKNYVNNGSQKPCENLDGNADYYAVLKKNDHGLHILDMPYTNLPRRCNTIAYEKIEQMLNDKLVASL